MIKFAAYIRVSTQGQGDSGLGLEAQMEAVKRYVASQKGELVNIFTEVESGTVADRPQMTAALDYCRKNKVVLVVGKLDRMARNVKYFLEVLDRSKVDIRFADLPDCRPNTDEGRMILINFANFAEFEANRISSRTKAAVAAKMARGEAVGFATHANPQATIQKAYEASAAVRGAQADAFAMNLSEDLMMRRRAGYTVHQIAEQWNKMGVKTARGGQWWGMTVNNMLKRIEGADRVTRVTRKDKKA
jgi:DNA invertase Pin-like site-specific DNA recombinase